mgnify:CR=1 FL=1
MTKNSALGESVGRSAGTLGVYPGGLQTHCTVVCLICQVLIFFVDICVSHGHNSCVGWFEISTSPRFRNIFCKKRVCGYTNSRLHPLKKRKIDYVHSDVVALFDVFSRRMYTSDRQQGSVPYRRRVSSTNRGNGDRYTPSFSVFDNCWRPLCVRWR